MYSHANASQLPLEIPATTTTPSDPPYTLDLSYATYLGTLDTANDILVFNNVRYAAAPTSTLRWQKPQPPLTTTGIQSDSKGGSCFNATPTWIGKVVLEAQC
jgi:Carboxylesterase family